MASSPVLFIFTSAAVCFVLATTATQIVEGKIVSMKDETEFNATVLDKDNDVFVMFTHAWCGHCVRAKPGYEELSEKYPGVVFAEFEGHRREIPISHRYNVRGHPTFLLFPKNDKSGKLLYHNARNVPKWTAWLDKQLGRESQPNPDL